MKDFERAISDAAELLWDPGYIFPQHCLEGILHTKQFRQVSTLDTS
ncbi:hypothetical protein PPTG_24953 [Phytophthora nicotianae INRA-310]|uniref:Uncharacterized protein n=1 Tax=Phytophthora nicotianae (strain INRA-310) TaxID=761204 RepID=W2PBR8_PHYN3|nr:hypothetical protein PPTG_24953 [Phytophthora nicotianae INRA-310]ETM97434.1 hypothetical protein PPTG_24953 [Phytophthora nicotianae INRA-310]